MDRHVTPKFRAQCIRSFSVLLYLIVLGVPSLATAHDFWIEPGIFQAKPKQTVPLRLFVGQNFKGDSVPYFPQKFERFVVAGPSGTRPITGVLGDEPAGKLIPDAPGLYVIGLHTKHDSVSFDSLEEFERYLTKEGLERNLAIERQRHQPGKKITETYFRCAKSLIAAGPLPDTAQDHVFGFPLELIAEKNPYRSSSLQVQLRYRGKALPGALVVAFTKAEPLKKLKARTDDHGRVVFQLPKPGVWLVTSVHMIPGSFFSGFDWESLWASLSFERP